MGVSGSGKSTLGKAIAEAFCFEFLDGDTFHSEANREKMKNCIPLTDEDRLPWLRQINKIIIKKMESRIVLACSALKNSYRETLSEQIPLNSILWIHLKSEFSVIKKRMERRNHFMPVRLLQSQFKTLETPKDALTFDCSQTVKKMIHQLKPYLDEY